MRFSSECGMSAREFKCFFRCFAVFRGFGGCFWCLGVWGLRMSAEALGLKVRDSWEETIISQKA